MIRLGRLWAGVIVVAGVGVALLGVLREMYPFAAVTGVASLLLSALGLYLSRHPAAGAVPRTQQREHAVETLVESVRLQWEEEAKIRGLFDPEPMPVHWTLKAPQEFADAIIAADGH